MRDKLRSNLIHLQWLDFTIAMDEAYVKYSSACTHIIVSTHARYLFVSFPGPIPESSVGWWQPVLRMLTQSRVTSCYHTIYITQVQAQLDRVIYGFIQWKVIDSNRNLDSPDHRPMVLDAVVIHIFLALTLIDHQSSETIKSNSNMNLVSFTSLGDPQTTYQAS